MRLSFDHAERLGIVDAVCSRCGHHHGWRKIDGRPPCPRCGKQIGTLIEPEQPKKRNKYRNIITNYHGVNYASKAEAAFAAELDRRKAAGEICGWLRQAKIFLPDYASVYVTDFMVIRNDGTVYAVDVKGVETAKFKADKRRWRLHGPCVLVVRDSRGKEYRVEPEPLPCDNPAAPT